MQNAFKYTVASPWLRLGCLLLALTLLTSSVPFSVFSIEPQEEDGRGNQFAGYGIHIGSTATLNFDHYSNLVISGDPTIDIADGVDLVATDFYTMPVLVITNYHWDPESLALWYKVEAAPGYTLPDKMLQNPWVFQNYTDVYGDEELEAIYPDVLIIDPPKNYIFDTDGNPISDIMLPQNGKITIHAASTLQGSVSYQWQACYDQQQDLWVDIKGAKNDAIALSYAMLATLADETGTVYVRSVSDSGSTQTTSAPIAVRFSEPAEKPPVSATNPSQPEPRSARYATRDVSDTVTITIRFVYGANPENMVAESLVATVIKGSNFDQFDGQALPTMEGYDAYLEDDTTICTVIDLELFNVQEDITITYYYWPAKVDYTVIYYWQNAQDDKYTEYERVTAQGFTGYNADVEQKTYEGYTILWYETVPIAADGSTVIEVYYDRLYYLMTFELDGGYGTNPIYARHGTPLSLPAPTKSSHLFVGWDLDGNGISDPTPTVMPMENTQYTAIWKADDVVEVSIVYWGENANDTEYSYISSETVNVKNGTSLTFLTGTNICSLEEHSHDGDCDFLCGKEDHKHTVTDGCYALICSETDHNHNSCTLACPHVHDLSCYSVPTNRTLKTSTKPTQTLTHIGNNIYTYVRNGSTYYCLNLGDQWYLVYNGSNQSKQAITFSCSHKTHEDACYTCGKLAGTHTHTLAGGCYELTCEIHAHDATCYKCIAHSHSDSCKIDGIAVNSNLWTYEKTEPSSLTVTAGEQNVINVYYKRTTFTLNFDGGSYVADKTISAKWGASIYKEFETAPLNTNRAWKCTDNQKYSDALQTLDVMPQFDADFEIYITSTNGRTEKTIYYYVEKPGANVSENTWPTSTANFELIKTVKTLFNHATYDEEYHEMVGYKRYTASVAGFSDDQKNFSNNTLYLYYLRDTFTLEFNNGDVIENKVSTDYGSPLSAYESYVPTMPDKYEEGSRVFAGWYLNPECTSKEYKLSEHTMPASNLLLYAKWVPVKHTVRFYTDQKLAEEKSEDVYSFVDDNGQTIQAVYDVFHGDNIQEMHTPPNDPENGKYTFIGWFYKDALGIEQMLDFKNTPVNDDMYVYAKWGSHTPMEYTVRFVYKDGSGNEIEIADPITGFALGGNSKTFEAKGNDQLYAGYREGYFPQIHSHTIVIDLDDPSKNEFTFYYIKKDAVPYSVYYLTETDPNNGKGTVTIDDKTYYLLADTKTVSDNKKAIVTETYKQIGNYLPNSYQETLTLNPDDADANKIIFLYTKDEVNGMYVIHYYFEDVTGGTYTENADLMIQNKAKIGTTVSAPTPAIENFTHIATAPGTVLEGTISKEVLQLHVYYNRNKYNYKVQYWEYGTNKVLKDSQVISAYFDDTVKATAPAIPHYTLRTESPAAITIRKDEADPKLNVITFYYEEIRATINYQVVGAGTVSPESESVKISTGSANGSTATPNEGYRFVGWFADAACTGESISTDAKYVPTKPGELWVDATYYAKFVPDVTTLTIEKTGVRQEDAHLTFLFRIQGDGVDLYVTLKDNQSITIAGLRVGATYTVTEITAWSYQYDFKSISNATGSTATIAKLDDTPGANVTLSMDTNHIVFENTYTGSDWLGGETSKDNSFDNYNP